MATNPLYNLGTASFKDDPYQVKVMRQQLMQAGMWNPAWDAWAMDQEGGTAQPDLSALDGYGLGGGDYGGGNRRADLVGPDGQTVVGNQYQYDEPALFQGEDLLQAAALVGGSALGANALFGGLGAAGGGIPLSAAEMGVGSMPAGMEGWGTLAASGAEAGGAAGGLGTLGTIAPGAGQVAGLATMGPELGSLLPSVAGLSGGGGGLGGLLSTLGSANGLANLGSAAIGLYGQNKAIGAMGDATNQANEFNRYAFDTIRADNKPLVDMRNSVLPQIQGLLSNPGSVMNDPGNQFQFAQGQKALANGAASQGMTYSGQQGKRLQEYGQNFASTKLDDSLRRLQSVAGLGQVGSNSNNNATANYAANGSNNALNMGNARGSVYGNMANIGGNALSNIFNPWQWDQVNGRGG